MYNKKENNLHQKRKTLKIIFTVNIINGIFTLLQYLITKRSSSFKIIFNIHFTLPLIEKWTYRYIKMNVKNKNFLDKLKNFCYNKYVR